MYARFLPEELGKVLILKPAPDPLCVCVCVRVCVCVCVRAGVPSPDSAPARHVQRRQPRTVL